MELQTTTHRGRNLALLRAAAGLVDIGDRPIRVLQVGPGLAVRYLGRLSGADAPLRPLFKGIETVLRRFPLPDSWFENYESGEILEVFSPRTVELTILDINPRSLALVSNHLSTVDVATLVGDISQEGLASQHGLTDWFDLVVALSTVSRVPEAARNSAAANLIESSAPGGLIVENTIDLQPIGGVEATNYDSIYRKLSRLPKL